MEKCDGEIEGPIIICTMNAKTKAKLKRDLRIRKALEIKRHNCGPGHGMNEDWGLYVKTTHIRHEDLFFFLKPNWSAKY